MLAAFYVMKNSIEARFGTAMLRDHPALQTKKTAEKSTSPHVSQDTAGCAFEEVVQRMIARHEHVIAG